MILLVGTAIGLAFALGHWLGRRSGHVQGVNDAATMWPQQRNGDAP